MLGALNSVTMMFCSFEKGPLGDFHLSIPLTKVHSLMPWKRPPPVLRRKSPTNHPHVRWEFTLIYIDLNWFT